MYLNNTPLFSLLLNPIKPGHLKINSQIIQGKLIYME